MVKVDLLKNHPEVIPRLSNIWYEVLGKIWMPEVGIDEIERLYYEELDNGVKSLIVAYDLSNLI